MGVVSFFEGLGQDVYHGLTWVYNETVGAFTNYIGNAALSASEQFFESLVAGFLSVIALFFGDISSLLLRAMGAMVTLSASMGIFGPLVAVALITAIGAGVLLAIKLVLDFL